LGASFEQVTRTGSATPSRPDLGEAPQASATRARSLLRAAPALVLFAIVLADAMRVADIDLWGHIRFGQAILTLRRLPRHDHYAYSAPGLVWRNHEWLSDVVLATVYDAFGIPGLKGLKFLCTGSTLVLLSAALSETGAALTIQFAVLAVTAIALVPQVQFRPQLFDYVFLAALIALLSHESYRRRRAPLWFAVPMLALWANLHGGFFIGLAVLGLYTLVTTMQNLACGKGFRPTLRLGLISAMAAVATLCNPWGIGEWQVVAHTLHNPYTMGRVTEFQPLLERLAELHRQGIPVFTFLDALLMFAALAVAVAATPRGDDWGLLAVAALMIAGAFDAVRNTALAVLAAAPPLARHAALALARLPRDQEAGHAALSAPVRLSVQVIAAGAALATAVGSGLFSPALPASSARPVGAVDFMAAHSLYGNVLNDHSWGDYLIWHGAPAPRSKVFIDSRFEMVYPLRIQRDYLAFASGSLPGAERVLDAYPTDFVLMPTGSPAYALMMAQTRWRLIYRDPVAALFARADSPAAHLPGVPVLRDTAPPSFFP
jgi:hypothetical protein